MRAHRSVGHQRGHQRGGADPVNLHVGRDAHIRCHQHSAADTHRALQQPHRDPEYQVILLVQEGLPVIAPSCVQSFPELHLRVLDGAAAVRWGLTRRALVHGRHGGLLLLVGRRRGRRRGRHRRRSGFEVREDAPLGDELVRLSGERERGGAPRARLRDIPRNVVRVLGGLVLFLRHERGGCAREERDPAPDPECLSAHPLGDHLADRGRGGSHRADGDRGGDVGDVVLGVRDASSGRRARHRDHAGADDLLRRHAQLLARGDENHRTSQARQGGEGARGRASGGGELPPPGLERRAHALGDVRHRRRRLKTRAHLGPTYSLAPCPRADAAGGRRPREKRRAPRGMEYSSRATGVAGRRLRRRCGAVCAKTRVAIGSR
mmetsp:Transcript_2110/g.8906  ORF Transcript_2110/g.8906 Transcript_2110/m.8906 type:complete len:378 (-) Transcript_2110:62-1195(-)